MRAMAKNNVTAVARTFNVFIWGCVIGVTFQLVKTEF